jgi:hypothetical protein
VAIDRADQLSRDSGLVAPSAASTLAAWEQVVSRARAAWPGVQFDDDVIAALVAPRLVGSDLPSALIAAPAVDLRAAARRCHRGGCRPRP